jgi:signal transduction histidine kinase
VRLTDGDRRLTFLVQDDGRGFDASQNSYGTGVRGMIDRLDAIGGRLEVESAPAAALASPETFRSSDARRL